MNRNSRWEKVMYYLDYILFKYHISHNHHSNTRCDGLQFHDLSLLFLVMLSLFYFSTLCSTPLQTWSPMLIWLSQHWAHDRRVYGLGNHWYDMLVHDVIGSSDSCLVYLNFNHNHHHDHIHHRPNLHCICTLPGNTRAPTWSIIQCWHLRPQHKPPWVGGSYRNSTGSWGHRVICQYIDTSTTMSFHLTPLCSIQMGRGSPTWSQCRYIPRGRWHGQRGGNAEDLHEVCCQFRPRQYTDMITGSERSSYITLTMQGRSKYRKFLDCLQECISHTFTTQIRYVLHIRCRSWPTSVPSQWRGCPGDNQWSSWFGCHLGASWRRPLLREHAGWWGCCGVIILPCHGFVYYLITCIVTGSLQCT